MLVGGKKVVGCLNQDRFVSQGEPLSLPQHGEEDLILHCIQLLRPMFDATVVTSRLSISLETSTAGPPDDATCHIYVAPSPGGE